MFALEYIVGPILALALGMKFTVYTKDQTIKELETKVTAMEKQLQSDLAQKMVVTMTPMAKVVRDLKETIGV